jgi:membrane-bound serine protease (ClpP class)
VKQALLRAFFASLAVAAVAFPSTPASAADRPRVLAVHFSLEINPATQDYVNHQIDRAARDGYDAVAILLDTPGGLSSSMEKIYEKVLVSKVPVIVYVSPPGAGAASAGVFVAQAADVLAMAPATNIGSSTPINGNGSNLGSDLRRKTINHFAAKLRALARSHGRNARWADAAVRRASNLTAGEALRLNVIDYVARDLPTLLNRIDGVKTKPRRFVLHTRNAEIVEVHPGFFTRLLNTLIDPNIITLLFLAGIAGLGYEIFHPGVVLPGALGAVSLLTALFGLAILPVSWAGLALMLLGIGLLVIDAHVTSHGALTVSGLIALAVGGAMLFRNAPQPYTTNVPVVVVVAVVLGALWAFALSRAVQVRHRPVAVGTHTIVGETGEVRGPGQVFVNGELWRARSVGRQRVRIERVDDAGLVLDVRAEEPAEATLAAPVSSSAGSARGASAATDRTDGGHRPRSSA